MRLESYSRKPLFVNAVQVTAENMEEVAAYFAEDGAKIEYEDNGNPYIHIAIKAVMSKRFSMAKVGDWIVLTTYAVRRNGEVQTKRSIRIFINKTFQREFELSKEAPNPDQMPLIDSVGSILYVNVDDPNGMGSVMSVTPDPNLAKEDEAIG